MKWRLSIWQLVGLVLYSCAFPVGFYLDTSLHYHNAFLICLINLPFLVILGPLLMMPLIHTSGQFVSFFVVWAIIFVQAYLAFIHLRNSTESSGVSIFEALVESVGRIGFVFLVLLLSGCLLLTFSKH